MKKPLLVSPMHCFILLLVFNYCFCIALQFLEGPFDHHLFRLQNPKVTNFNSVNAFWKQNGWNLIFKCTWNIPKFSLKIVFFKKIRISVFLQLYCITNACTNMYWSNQSFNPPPPPLPGHTPGIWHLCCPGEEGIWLSESSRVGKFYPHAKGGEFESYPRFHVKSLGAFHCTWWAIMADTVLEDFRGRDCAFVANWLQGKSETSFVPYLKVFRF